MDKKESSLELNTCLISKTVWLQATETIATPTPEVQQYTKSSPRCWAKKLALPRAKEDPCIITIKKPTSMEGMELLVLRLHLALDWPTLRSTMDRRHAPWPCMETVLQIKANYSNLQIWLLCGIYPSFISVKITTMQWEPPTRDRPKIINSMQEITVFQALNAMVKTSLTWLRQWNSQKTMRLTKDLFSSILKLIDITDTVCLIQAFHTDQEMRWWKLERLETLYLLLRSI